MQRRIIIIPPTLFRLTAADWDIAWRGQSSGDANDGVTTTVYNAFPRFVAEPQIVLKPNEVAQWRAVRAHARGRIGIYRVRMCDPVGFARKAVAPGASSWLALGTPHASGSLFANGLGYWFDPFVTAAAAASAGAEAIRVDTTASGGVAPKPGQIMSAADWPFIVTSVSEVSASVRELTVEPALRKPIAAGDTILMTGAGLFEIAEDRTGNPSYDTSRVSRLGIALREVISR